MNRRTFLKSLTAAAAIPFIPLPKVEAKPAANYMHFHKPINWQVPDILDKLGMQRGIARDMLMYDVLPTPHTFARYIISYNDYFAMMVYHDRDLNDKRMEVSMGHRSDGELPIYIGHHIITAKKIEEAEIKLKEKEDLLFIRLANTASQKINIKAAYLKDNKNSITDIINKAFLLIERQDMTVANVVMHPDMYRESLRPYAGVTIIDEIATEKFLKCPNIVIEHPYNPSTGQIGNLWTANLRMSNLMPKSKILLTCPADYLGVMPVKVPQYKQEMPNDWYISEQGMAILNNQLLVTIELS